MDKRIGFGACLVGVVILHSLIFSATDSNSSKTNTVSKIGQNQPVPKYSGVIFAGTEANLIPPTNKQQHQAQLDATVNPVVNADRDPFATIPGTFVAPPPLPLPEPPSYRPQPPSPAPIAKVEPHQPKVTPPPPTVLEAEEIKVTGAMEIAGKTYAIVSLPGSGSSQYVTEGERLAGSKVLVKSIDLSDRPLVILEQNNAEFTHTIDQS